MYAVIRQGGHQYRVAPGDVIQIEKIDAEDGAEVALEDVLLLQSGAGIEIGEPRIGSAVVKAKVVRAGKGPKVIGYKFKRRKGYSKRWGHRQPFIELRILSISKDGRELS